VQNESFINWFQAIRHNDVGLMMKTLEGCPAVLDATDDGGLTALHLAIQQSNEKIVGLLLERRMSCCSW
jgi:ankyrin repeat protein